MRTFTPYFFKILDTHHFAILTRQHFLVLILSHSKNIMKKIKLAFILLSSFNYKPFPSPYSLTPYTLYIQHFTIQLFTYILTLTPYTLHPTTYTINFPYYTIQCSYTLTPNPITYIIHLNTTPFYTVIHFYPDPHTLYPTHHSIMFYNLTLLHSCSPLPLPSTPYTLHPTFFTVNHCCYTIQ